ncbi:MAG: hypothetical protein Q9195_002869 [Heterodermia aff. obscurata]
MMHLMTSSSRRSLARFVASSPVRSRPFRTTSPALVAVNDRVPDLDLVEDSPGNKVNLSQELAHGQGLIIGVPAAFTYVTGRLSKSYLVDYHYLTTMLSRDSHLKDLLQVYIHYMLFE